MRKVNKLTPFGKAVKMRLIEMDMSVRDLAKQIGTSPVQISRMLHGEQPGYEIVPRMLDILDITLEDVGA